MAVARRVLLDRMAKQTRWVAIAALVFATSAWLVATGADAGPPEGGPPAWQDQADAALGGGRGIGPRLMTEEEWRAHREQMQTLKGEERERARQAWHEQMRQRAKEKGITLPATPGPHRGGPGGMGAGRGGPPRD